MNRVVATLLAILVAAIAAADVPVFQPRPGARRLEVLFFGAPTNNHPGHDPVTRYRVLKQHLGDDGVNVSYLEDPAEVFRPETLARYDALLMYGNWEQDGPMPAAQEQALLDFVARGGGFLPIHCASACYGGSDAFVRLVGARFRSHGSGVFRVSDVCPGHPILVGGEGFEAWDETYVHDRHGDDRLILQRRGEEAWTWVRQHGKGRVFYTAAGHDHRVWDLPAFHGLLLRAICWCVGPETYQKLEALRLPVLESEEMTLPGYRERKAIDRGQKPLSPEDSLKLAQVPAGFEVSLFACEPDVVNPIHIAWDHRGRAFVIETVDYPNNLQAGKLGNDRIKVCEDTDGDGRADKFTVFADGLSIPSTLAFARGGVICTNGTEVLFLKDTDGDDRADTREPMFAGFSMHDTHAGPSNFRYGFDNWIHATVGYSGFRGEVGGRVQQFATGYFRFTPDGSALEFLQNTTNNTWGLGFTPDFDVLGSTANGNPSWQFTFPRERYLEAGLEPPRTPRADDNPLFFSSSTDIRQVDNFDRYTAAAGHSYYTAERFPPEFRGRVALVAEPTAKLLGCFELEVEGASWRSRQWPNNLFNSADAWSSPVCAETGPDGAVWICDWYNLIIQHNPTPNLASAGMDAATGKGNAYVTPVRDTSHGRIWRVYPRGTADDPQPVLDPARPASLTAALGHPNLLWRLHAQRLLVERGGREVAPELAALARAGTRASVHAFEAMRGLGALDAATVGLALDSPLRALRRAALAAAPDLAPQELAARAAGILAAADLLPRDRAETLVALARLAPDAGLGAVLHRLAADSPQQVLEDPLLRDAWQMAARRHAAGVLAAAAKAERGETGTAPAAANLAPNPGFETAEAGKPAGWQLRHYSSDRPEAVGFSVSADGRGGTPCLRIEAAARSDCGALARIRVEPRSRYRCSAWVRTDKLEPARGPGALINLNGGPRSGQALSGTTPWTELSFEFDSGERREVEFNCLFGGYCGATGTAFWDDVTITRLGGERGGVRGEVEQVAERFAATADARQRDELRAALAGAGGGLAKMLLEKLAARPAPGPAAVARRFEPDPAVHERGRAVYQRTCIACHGADAKGVPGAFPPLEGSEWLAGDPSIPVRIVLHGLLGPVTVQGRAFQNVMPPVAGLTDQEVADVVTLVRQSWGNDAAPVTATEVAKVRAAHAGRVLPWTAAELK